MPNTTSAKKRLRQNLVRRLRNRARKSELRTVIKRVREAIAAGDVAQAEATYKLAQEKLDRAGARGVIHVNKAARSKARLTAAIKAVKAGTAAAS